jgi:hypothetical protein
MCRKLYDLGYIKSSIERIEKRLDNSESKFDGIFTRLARVEESVASAHKRMNEQIINKRTGGKKMNEILINVISVVVTSVVLPLITFAGVKLTQWLNTKIKNEKAKQLLAGITDIITSNVASVFQTYVEALKKKVSLIKKHRLRR